MFNTFLLIFGKYNHQQVRLTPCPSSSPPGCKWYTTHVPQRLSGVWQPTPPKQNFNNQRKEKQNFNVPLFQSKDMKYCKTELPIRAWVHQPLRSGYKMGPFSTKRFHTGHNQVHYWTKTQCFAFLHQQERYCMHDKFQHQHFKRLLNMETMVKKVSNTFWRILTVMGDLFTEEICQIVV